eukprot:scaffold364_cov224-Alexandrium_tamarense.AAC.4
MNENSNQTASQTACFSDGNKDRQTSVLPSSYLPPSLPPRCAMIEESAKSYDEERGGLWWVHTVAGKLALLWCSVGIAV